jgi:hypothetical protein
MQGGIREDNKEGGKNKHTRAVSTAPKQRGDSAIESRQGKLRHPNAPVGIQGNILLFGRIMSPTKRIFQYQSTFASPGPAPGLVNNSSKN